MATSTIVSNDSKLLSLDDWIQNPPERTEWVDGKFVEKTGMTAKHGRTQARLATYWTNYKNSNNQGGEVYTETPCRTVGRGRSPDVSYLTPELLTQFPDFTVLPQSFPLIAVQGYERVLPYVLENEPMFMLLKALISKGFGVVPQTLNNYFANH